MVFLCVGFLGPTLVVGDYSLSVSDEWEGSPRTADVASSPSVYTVLTLSDDSSAVSGAKERSSVIDGPVVVFGMKTGGGDGKEERIFRGTGIGKTGRKEDGGEEGSEESE